MALAAIGIYSVISYNVTQRVQEIGVRMALGAKRGDILGLILVMVAKFASLGPLLGSLAASSSSAWYASRCSRGTSFGVAPLTAIMLLLAAVALLAAWLPAARAGNLDPGDL